MRVAVLSLLLGENLWVVITGAAAALMERLLSLLSLTVAFDLAQVQLMALLLVLLELLVLLAQDEVNQDVLFVNKDYEQPDYLLLL